MIYYTVTAVTILVTVCTSSRVSTEMGDRLRINRIGINQLLRPTQPGIPPWVAHNFHKYTGDVSAATARAKTASSA